MKHLTTLAALLVSLTTATAQNNAPFHIAEATAQGFSIVSANGRQLAYSTTPCDTLNPGLKWWMKSISHLSPEALQRTPTPPSAMSFPDSVPPLLTTSWGQMAPYNYMCPLPDYSPWGGYMPDTTHCPTGCVATATAQIMHRFRHPHRGKGTASVNPEQQQGTTVYTVDFSQATYDWDLMLDDYSGDYTEDEARAVAQLNYHVGVACRMGYRSDASATDNFYALQALWRHFDYDSLSIQSLERNAYSEQEWMQLVYTELSEGRPILYEGLGIDLGDYGVYGHSFVVDGYDANGLVHVNWGWSGRANGYYDIALLNPLDLAFDDFQMMAIGLQPLTSTEAIASPHPTPRETNARPGVYALDGRLLRQASSLSQLPPGIYLCNGRKHIVR
ncbi:MAG: C10 family peptidase [Prevotella sp.]|nr:C10 family peptidase [Prevotella sp.]